MRIAIIDDEPSLIKLTSHTISDYGIRKNLSIEIDSFQSGSEFLDNYTPGTYSVLFVDVFMPEMSGIDTVLKLREADPNVSVIFLTSSESHMKDALSCHAFDYLVKPATRSDFFKVLDDVIQFLGNDALSDAAYIEFKSKGVSVRLSSRQIISAVSNGHNVTVSTKEISYDAKETFTVISDSLLKCENFLLINRGVLVNMDYITKIDDGCCYLTTGDCYTIKVKGAKSVHQAYEDYRQSNA